MRGTSDGLIIKERAMGESDKLLTVLTADKGKILICAKGVRSLKSKNASLCHAFTYANFEYYERNGMFWLASGEVKEHFLGLGSPLTSPTLRTSYRERIFRTPRFCGFCSTPFSQ